MSIAKLRPAALTAISLAALPFLAKALIPTPLSIIGFAISHYYYSGAQAVFGKSLFPFGNFGAYPADELAVAVASGSYATLGFAVVLLATRAKNPVK